MLIRLWDGQGQDWGREDVKKRRPGHGRNQDRRLRSIMVAVCGYDDDRTGMGTNLDMIGRKLEGAKGIHVIGQHLIRI